MRKREFNRILRRAEKDLAKHIEEQWLRWIDEIYQRQESMDEGRGHA